jgi:hypothetical protein
MLMIEAMISARLWKRAQAGLCGHAKLSCGIAADIMTVGINSTLIRSFPHQKASP